MPTIYKNIINGYDQVAALTEVEKKSLIYVLYSIQMISIAYFGEQNDYQALAEDNYNGLCWIYEHREEL